MGKFYRPGMEAYLPIYLDRDSMGALLRYSEKKGVGVGSIVRDWIKKDVSS